MTRHRRPWPVVASVAALSLALAACGGDDGEASPTDAGAEGGSVEIQALIASSGDPETQAVTEAADAWAADTGNTVEVLPAQDLVQQMGQGFAGGNPADAFYVESGFVRGWATQGSLHPYGDQITDVDDFVESLRDAFTFEDQLYCVPKDFSTLALVINTDMWEAAGLGDADVPTTWEELTAVGTKLTKGGTVGLAIPPDFDRMGVFMLQAGGWVVNDDETEITADSPENLEALTYVQDSIKEGWMALTTDIGAGWAGEALGLEKAAMVIEGNWIKGAMSNDYPDVPYQVVELPAGPAGQGTMQFTVCWGVAAQSPENEQAAAVDMIDTIMTPESQLGFAESFGVMPSRQSALDQYKTDYPEDAAFAAGADYGRVPPTFVGWSEVKAELNSQLSQIAKADPAKILADLQTNMEASLGG